MSSVMRALSLVSLGTFVLLGCSQDTVSVPVISFERPGAMTFGCLDVGAGSVVPLDDCAGTDDSTHRLLGFVAQTSRGELATVDLTTKAVVDLDTRVPGFTFARTGEVPIAVVTPPLSPGMTYVANYGSRTVESIPTARLHPEIADTGLAPTEVQLPGSPTALVASCSSSDQ